MSRSAKRQSHIRDLGSYENVLAAFKRYDKNNDGKLTYSELHDLMSFLNNGRWTEDKTNRLLLHIDTDGNGSLSVEELVGYIFPRSSAMGGTTGLSDYEKVVEHFRSFDSDRNGVLDKAEFTRLMHTLRQGAWTSRHTDYVFENVDKDKSGMVDSAELVAFIFGVPHERRQTASAQSVPGRRRTAEQRQAAAGALVVIDMVVGPRQGEQWARKMASSWQRKFGDKVEYRVTVDKHVDGVMRVTARDGQVVFYDKPSMMMYRDNPFETLKSAEAWIEDVGRRHIPRLISGT